MYNTDFTNIHEVLDSFYNIMFSMEFATEDETNNKIKFLDITISKVNNNISFDIHFKNLRQQNLSSHKTHAIPQNIK
jgi:hypothetical protein